MSSESNDAYEKLAKAFCRFPHECVLRIEAICQVLGISSSTLRTWTSTKGGLKFDAPQGLRGRRVLYSPYDAMLFSIMAEMNHTGMYFRGKSNAQRLEGLGGTSTDKPVMNDEIVLEVGLSCAAFINKIADDKEAAHVMRYFAITSQNGNVRCLRVNAMEELKELSSGLVAVFDCVKISLNALACLSKSAYPSV